jgi:hypothetical protein
LEIDQEMTKREERGLETWQSMVVENSDDASLLELLQSSALSTINYKQAPGKLKCGSFSPAGQAHLADRIRWYGQPEPQ